MKPRVFQAMGQTSYSSAATVLAAPCELAVRTSELPVPKVYINNNITKARDCERREREKTHSYDIISYHMGDYEKSDDGYYRREKHTLARTQHGSYPSVPHNLQQWFPPKRHPTPPSRHPRSNTTEPAGALVLSHESGSHAPSGREF